MRCTELCNQKYNYKGQLGCQLQVNLRKIVRQFLNKMEKIFLQLTFKLTNIYLIISFFFSAINSGPTVTSLEAASAVSRKSRLCIDLFQSSRKLVGKLSKARRID